MLLTTRVALVAPPRCELFERLVPLKDHWYLSGVWPVTLTVKAALLPASKLWLCGCWVMLGTDCAKAVCWARAPSRRIAKSQRLSLASEVSIGLHLAGRAANSSLRRR